MLPFYADLTAIQNAEILKDERRKKEMVRIMIQTPESMGYGGAASKLMEESGISVENEHLTNFRSAILRGEWDKAIDLLRLIDLNEEAVQGAKYLIYEQKYLELIDAKNVNDALNVLRNELSSLSRDTQRLHKLAGLILCRDAGELRKKMNWEGTGPESRNKLIAQIQMECKPTEMLETKRLEKLLKQAVSFQVLNCQFHYDINPNFSLLEEHSCDAEEIPTRPLQILNEHVDEIWLLKFSPDGNYLASVAKNMMLIVWEFDPETFMMKLRIKKEGIHNKDVNALNWSPDSKKLLTASADTSVKIWNAETGDCIRTLQGHSEIVTSAIWLPDSNKILSGGIDSCLNLWTSSGEKLWTMKTNRVSDLLVENEGKILFAICASFHRILVIDLQKREEIKNIEEKDVIISASMSKDNRFLLVNTSYKNPELHLWCLKSFEMVQRYTGHFQEKYMIRCTFGGRGDRLICCGGEDARIYIWHRNLGKPLQVLTGHTLTVNCVAWNPTNPKIFASGSDDYSIRLWCTEDIKSSLKNGNQIEEEKEDEELDEFPEEIDRHLEGIHEGSVSSNMSQGHTHTHTQHYHNDDLYLSKSKPRPPLSHSLSLVYSTTHTHTPQEQQIIQCDKNPRARVSCAVYLQNSKTYQKPTNLFLLSTCRTLGFFLLKMLHSLFHYTVIFLVSIKASLVPVW
eukprot:TRINITY_DN1077_c0_g1_i7.p1 TRINITY_DN1077_c0_g1~~TRINITY_DN1077_c0_g1_i7.p1  ORF type:complete len:683 (+),score=130.07 TRINITY_DN1077_c0_g1_i7:1-2049(+)